MTSDLARPRIPHVHSTRAPITKAQAQLKADRSKSARPCRTFSVEPGAAPTPCGGPAPRQSGPGHWGTGRAALTNPVRSAEWPEARGSWPHATPPRAGLARSSNSKHMCAQKKRHNGCRLKALGGKEGGAVPAKRAPSPWPPVSACSSMESRDGNTTLTLMDSSGRAMLP